MLAKVYTLKRPKTNVQIIQQSVLLKYKYYMRFLRLHGTDVYMEVREGVEGEGKGNRTRLRTSCCLRRTGRDSVSGCARAPTASAVDSHQACGRAGLRARTVHVPLPRQHAHYINVPFLVHTDDPTTDALSPPTPQIRNKYGGVLSRSLAPAHACLSCTSKFLCSPMTSICH